MHAFTTIAGIAGAIAAYHQQTDFPVIPILLTDDAPQFKRLTYEQALCWVHDGRNYKKLHPVVPVHREKLKKFLGRYWDYYRKLLEFKESPTPEEAEALSAEFNALFSTKTRYPALDYRIAKTLDKKSELLMTLKHPEVPTNIKNTARSVFSHLPSTPALFIADSFIWFLIPLSVLSCFFLWVFRLVE